MAPRFSRRRRDGDDPPDPPRDPDNVDMQSDEHAWWAQRELSNPWVASAEPDPDDPPPRDVLAEHLGDDWRWQFGLDGSSERGDTSYATAAAPEPEPEPEPLPEVDTSDPYAVLGLDPSASWEEIVTAHRDQARRNHPDRLFGRPDGEVRAAEQRIRDINVAYQELRIRRGK